MNNKLPEWEKEAIKYCEKVGSFYFDYTDEANELIHAFKAGMEFQKNQENKQLDQAVAIFKRYKGIKVSVNVPDEGPCDIDLATEFLENKDDL